MRCCRATFHRDPPDTLSAKKSRRSTGRHTYAVLQVPDSNKNRPRGLRSSRYTRTRGSSTPLGHTTYQISPVARPYLSSAMESPPPRLAPLHNRLSPSDGPNRRSFPGESARSQSGFSQKCQSRLCGVRYAWWRYLAALPLPCMVRHQVRSRSVRKTFLHTIDPAPLRGRFTTSEFRSFLQNSLPTAPATLALRATLGVPLLGKRRPEPH